MIKLVSVWHSQMICHVDFRYLFLKRAELHSTQMGVISKRKEKKKKSKEEKTSMPIILELQVAGIKQNLCTIWTVCNGSNCVRRSYTHTNCKDNLL